MSAKFLHSISDDPNLEKQIEKQIGCMTGIFQMFDRHQILAVKRLYGQKKLPAARRSSSCESPRPDDKTLSVQYVGVDDNPRSQVDSSGHSNAEPSSRGASRASSVDYSSSSRFSASIPESMASEKLEAARSSWDERVTKSLNAKDPRRLSADTRGNASILSKEPPSPSLDSRQAGRLSLDIRDVVRDSFYRDCPRLSVEIKADERAQSREGNKYVLKPKDSPRPPMDVNDASKQQKSSPSFSPKVGKKPKSQTQVSSDGKSRTSTDKASEGANKSSRPLSDLNESLRVLATLREAPWNFVESKEAPRPSFESKEGPRSSFLKDSPRFSYDGKEIPRSSSLKLREPPRLSLDSRESLRNFVDLKRNASVNDTPNTTQRRGHSSGDFIELEQCSGNKRSPSVVARLMGLEEMPTGSSTPSQKREVPNHCSSEEESVSRTSAEVRKSLEYLKVESHNRSREKENSLIELSKSHNFKQQFRTERSNLVEETDDRKLTSTRHIQCSDSPRFKHQETIPKAILAQRCPVETAPWRQPDSCQTLPRKAVEAQHFLSDLNRKNDGSSQDLYSEIEKRLKLLELENCDKDLRTLKQILEAMQHKGLLDSTKERLNRHQNDGSCTPRSRVFQEAKPTSRASEMQGYHMKSGSSNFATAFEAPIVIMKPTKLVNKSNNSTHGPIEGFPGSPRKVGSINQSRNADCKRSIVGSTKVLKDPQSGKPNNRESTYNNELTSPRQNKREQNSRTKSVEQSGQVSQRGRPCSPSPSSSPTRSQQISREIINNAKNNHRSFSTPKVQGRKTEVERKPRQSGSLKSPKQGTKLFGSETENRSPRNRIRTKGSSVVHLEEVSECSRDTAGDQCPDTPRADEISLRSESNLSSISHMDYEVTSSERSYTSKISDVKEEYGCKFDNENYYGVQSTGSTNAKLKKTSHFRTDYQASSAMTRHEIRKNSPKSKDEELHSKMEQLHLNQCEELSTSSTAPEASEQPSPVSVLDASLFYQEDLSPSPVKKCLIPFKEGETREACNQDQWIDFNYYSPDPIPVSPMAINSKLLKNVESLVRKLEDLASTEDTTMDLQTKSIAIANQNKAPEYKYMLEILSASGLLQKDPDSIPMEFHASGFPINPELFHILEQKRNSQKSDDQEKLNTELLFGTVNDILQRKLYPYLQLQQPWITKQHNSLLACMRPSGEHLVKLVWDELQGLLSSSPPVDLCENIFSIMEKDLAENAERWCDYRSEIGEVVLDVERMIFKDLIDETMGMLGYRVSRHPSSSSPITTDQTIRSRRQLLF